MSEETKYAPIIIPTLNRIDHLRDCIDSLRNNTWAEKTDLFISLDYPPSDRYREGYEKAKNYLESGISGFKECHIYYQDRNLGPYENYAFLVDEVRKYFDRFIYTEDDNVFSPCFLDYINKGMELFSDSKSIIMLTGFNFPWHDTYLPNNVGEIYAFMPWGFGMTVENYDFLAGNITRRNFDRILRDKSISSKMFRERPDLFRVLLEATLANEKNRKSVYRKHLYKNGELAPVDLLCSIVMYLYGKYTICPELSMVRNCGNEDGSGCNTASYSDGFKYSEQEIDSSKEFEFNIERELKGPCYDGAVAYYPAGKRAWILRGIYIICGKSITRVIMELSYHFTRIVSRLFLNVDTSEYRRD